MKAKQLKLTLLATVLSASFAAPAFAIEAPIATLPQFTAADTQLMFEQDAKPMQLAALSSKEMKETEGAWVWWAAAAGIGGTMNTIGYIDSNSNWTVGGASYSFLAGASGSLIATLPGGNLYRLGYGALGAYAGLQP